MTIIRELVHWLLGHGAPVDAEKQHAGRTTNTYPSSSPASRLKGLNVVTTSDAALVPPTDKLLVFRSLTGIDTVPTLRACGHASRAALNHGIYPRVVRAERQAKRGYRVFNVAINACLGIQMIVAAALTALGAANGSRAAVTGFGALNTIVAGILTYLKGSGLPNRLKYVGDEFRTVREYIEQREREFCLADCPLNPYEEVHVVDNMYSSAKRNMDSGTGHGGGGQRHNSAHQTYRPSSELGQMVQRFANFTESTAPQKSGTAACTCKNKKVQEQLPKQND